MNYHDSLIEVLKVRFKDERSGHDIFHLERVHNIALHLQEKEGGDKEVIAVSALLHDVHRLMQNRTGKFVYPKESLPEVGDLLSKVNFSEEKISMVFHCIEFHEEYSFSEKARSVNDIETLILQDADNLDAIGAIGIGRTFMYSGAYGLPMWDPEIPFDTERPYDEYMGDDPSTLHHFHRKLLRLEDSMNTETAKVMARQRSKFVKEFAERFLKEWKGEA